MPSRIASQMEREDVEIDARRAMTPARKRRIWEAWGRKCWFCRMPVDAIGPRVIYDHVGTLWITGSDADEDIGPIHAEPCNKLKTAADQARIAKTRGMRKLRLDEPREPSRRQLKGRKLRKHPTLKRNMAGKVVERDL